MEKKKILIIAGIIIIAVFGMGFLKDQIIKTVVTIAATRVSGAPVHIDGLSLSFIKTAVQISGFKMYNPRGFPRGILLEIPKIYVDFSLRALFKKKIYITIAEIDLKEVGVLKDKEGKLNVDSLKITKQEVKKEKQMPLRIDLLNLGIGKIVYKDYSAGQEPLTHVYDINIEKSYKNINSAQELTALVLAESLKAAGVKTAIAYGVYALAGVAVLPVAVTATLVSKDSVQEDFDVAFGQMYKISLKVLKRISRVIREDQTAGIIGAEINSASVTLKLKKITDQKTQVTVSARMYLLPKPEIAKGVIYQISEELKRM